MLAEQDRLSAIRSVFPAEGLFADKDWLISPDAFPIEAKFERELEQLGHQLFVFQRACNQLYQLSVKGKQPPWIAAYLDAGKPAELVEFSRLKQFRDQLPLVIRPDLILTDEGFTIAEIDSVPGGIGLTGWLNQTYAQFNPEVIGGPTGMIEGFRACLPNGGDIVIAEESATYRPEMQWLAAQLNERAVASDARRGPDDTQSGSAAPIDRDYNWNVRGAEDYEAVAGRDVYRFFELFDLPNLPRVGELMRAAADVSIKVTPPFKPFLEEKMWFALFWLRPLREFWRRELGDKYFLKLQQVIPYSWLLDPAPLPQHAVIPRLEIHDWREAGKLSQKERDLVLKVSGFSPLGWGSRGVIVGSDVPQSEWEAEINKALENFWSEPRLLQRFHKARLIEHGYFDKDSGEIQTMRGRVRLCPYYFVESDKVQLRGVLATIVPADKKLLHGMRDAIMVPSARAQS
ncbi:MAG: hypothetical protein ACJ8KU_09525 [Chthoniobacterales bacterium]